MITLSRDLVRSRLAALYADPQALRDALAPGLPPESVRAWLGRLRLLYGVPVQYLVPDERMLPPESIRFFYLDANWVDALVDGAFSLGRTLTPRGDTPGVNLDRAVVPAVRDHSDRASATLRPAALGMPAPAVSFQTVAGFLLRSSLVAAYPGLGVNAYPSGGTPSDPQITLLPIVRMERLGAAGDTLLCLIAGDPVRVDVHEAPEALHYGIDTFTPGGAATKSIYPFTRAADGSVTMGQTPVTMDLAGGGAFRAGAPRTLEMTTVASLIAAAQSPPLATPVDSAVMGFEMTEGVGMVSFNRNPS